jgi:hypothetical protein
VNAPTITRSDYLAAFETWFRVCAENGTAPYAPEFPDQWRAVVASADLPDEAPIDAFCRILAPLIERHACHFAIGKSSFLDRAIYVREPLRTVKCPKHDGHWSGVEMPRDWPYSNHCYHGCELTGWLPAGAVPIGILDALWTQHIVTGALPRPVWEW